jgi:hypothetical protein
MLSTIDFEKLLFIYNTEGKNMSIQTFCVNSRGNYRAFGKWFRNTHKDIVLVQIVDGSEVETYVNKKPVVERSEESDDPSYGRMMGIEVLRYFQAFSESLMKAAVTFMK